MSEHLQDLSMPQVVTRITFSCGVTVLVAAGAYVGLRWLFSI